MNQTVILQRKGSKGGFGKWAFFEIFDPWNTKTMVAGFIWTGRIDL